MTPNLLSISLILVLIYTLGCSSLDHLQYIEASKPDLIPQVFAPGFISLSSESEFGSVFTKDGKEFYYGVDIEGKAEIRFTRLAQETWTKPKVILVDENYSYNDPFLSPDEQRLYYISDQPRPGVDTSQGIDIWYSEKTGDGWSKPINAGNAINSLKEEYYISFSEAGTMYFSSNVDNSHPRNFDIYASKQIGGVFQTPIRLSDSINTNRYEADVFVAPDESYLIFCAIRRDGLGIGDLYISFKDEEGTWTQAENMGPTINSEKHELCPFVTGDGKYFFYTSNQDIYWVSAEILNTFRPGAATDYSR